VFWPCGFIGYLLKGLSYSVSDGVMVIGVHTWYRRMDDLDVPTGGTFTDRWSPS